MDLDQLRLFAEVVEEGSFTRVAERNFISQPAVSARISKLEEELGVCLLERTTRRVLVTEEGRILHDYAREILARVHEAQAVLQERRDRMVGSLRLATVHSIGLYELPATLKEFIRRYPEVQIHVDYQQADHVYRAVLEGAADLGLVAYPESRPGLAAIPFLEDELVLICSPEHSFAGRTEVSIEELDGERFVGFQSEIPTRRHTDALFQEHRVRPDLRMECDNIEILKKMVEVGLGVSLVPQLSAREESRRGSLHLVRLRGHRILRPVALVRRRSAMLSRTQQAFVDLLTTEGERLLREDVERADGVPVRAE